MQEQRAFERFPIALQAEYCIDDGPGAACRLVDISEKGTCIACAADDRLVPDARLELLIRFPVQKKPIPAAFAVKWVRPKEQDEEGFSQLAGGALLFSSRRYKALVKEYVVKLYASLHRLQMK
ncbi:PilZ domain-containing protein [Thermodesulfobacteriota bacterium]